MVFNFGTKICVFINNYVLHGKKQPHQETEDGYFSVKTLWLMCTSDNWTYRHGRKSQNFETIYEESTTYFSVTVEYGRTISL